MGNNSEFSLSGETRFFRRDPCPNCKANLWRSDWVFKHKSKGRERFSCFYCGYDEYPGGAVNSRLAEQLIQQEELGDEALA